MAQSKSTETESKEGGDRQYDLTFTLEDVGLPANEELREEVVENIQGVMSYAIRNADPGFEADFSAPATLSIAGVSAAGSTDDQGRWAETKITGEGVSTTMYALDSEGNPTVNDESWIAWADIFSEDAAWGDISEAVNGIEHKQIPVGDGRERGN